MTRAFAAYRMLRMTASRPAKHRVGVDGHMWIRGPPPRAVGSLRSGRAGTVWRSVRRGHLVAGHSQAGLYDLQRRRPAEPGTAVRSRFNDARPEHRLRAGSECIEQRTALPARPDRIHPGWSVRAVT